MLSAVIVFALTYLAIASQQLSFLRLDRPAAALVGAVAMVGVGALSVDQALAAIDLHVVGLLLGVLLIAAYLREAQFFRLCAYLVLTRTRSARALLWGIVLVSGALSALLLNDTVCVVMTPLIVAVVVEADLPALPFLFALMSATNIGGVVSFSGNPQNMIVGAAAHGHPSFAAYFAIAGPVGVACLCANAAVLVWLFGKQLPRGGVATRATSRPVVDRWLAACGLGALLLFAVLALVGMELTSAALLSAALLILVARREPATVMSSIDWPLLLFFAALFIVVAGIAQSGALAALFARVAPLIGKGDLVGNAIFASFITLGSNIVSNVPLVILVERLVPQLHDPTWGWIILAIASTLAGNLTIFGSIANMIVLQGAGEHGRIGFWRFLRTGVVLTMTSAVVTIAVLAIEFYSGYANWVLSRS